MRKRHLLGPLSDLADGRGRPIQASTDVYSLWLEHSEGRVEACSVRQRGLKQTLAAGLSIAV